MSDYEEDHNPRHEDDSIANPDAEDNEEEEQAAPSTPKKHRRRQDAEEEEEEEEEEGNDDEDDEEDEEDDEDEGISRGKKRQKVPLYWVQRKPKKSAAARFLDVEAEVDEDEDEDEEDEEFGKDDFLADPGLEADDLDDHHRRAADHARLDRRERELSDQDLARIAQDVTRRYKPSGQKYTGDMNEMPQRLLMPSVNDANLWQVRVKPGRERDLVFNLMRKAMDLEFSPRPLQILSAFQRDSLPGMIYVEARSSQHVSQACNGLVGVYPSRGINLVPIEEMASLLQIKKKDTSVTPGSWVRIKRGKYAGDLAQVMDMTENGEEVGLKFLPRIDLNPKDDVLVDGRKRKKLGSALSSVTRPPQRFFNYEEVIKAHGRRAVVKRNQVYVFGNDTFKDGYIEKDFKLSALILENVNPSLDEIMRFTRQEDGGENDQNVDLSIIAEASKKEAITVLQPGDHVEVFEGEQTGVHGIVESIAHDVVTLRAVGVDIDGQKVDVPARSVRKRFKPGDHVKVMAGHNADETGLVVSVMDNVVTFLSDMSMQEVSVFSKDLREAAEVGSSTNVIGNYELHDLVQLDMQTVGVIFKTERDSFRVLDQNGQVRLVQPHQISMRRDSNRAIATDSEGHELRVGDNVKEVAGEERKGQVLHIHQSFSAFLHNREITENGGVFVTRARNLASLAPKGNIAKTGVADLSKMNPNIGGVPAAAGGMVGSQMGRGPRDRYAGHPCAVIKGNFKGYSGTVKDTNQSLARVELHAGNKTISIDITKTKYRKPDGSLLKWEDFFAGFRGSMGPPQGRPSQNGGTSNPYTQGAGGRTPAWGAHGAGERTPAWTSRTPNPYADGGRTPAWNAAARTPNPYADGSKTPAWNAASRTPNPYAGGGNQTPAWQAASRTPNPYANNDGNRTPGPGAGWGGSSRTPMHPSSSSNSAWDNTSWGGGGWVSKNY
ncbi:transcription elongation factor Spt5 [Rickenella mellea]|uniref:Transcription elongation factor SPT5 n=1 Tax=Rickenella mellea TaxID=50990 RepID=A0A4Y7QKS3_9AGAM|nr:transcription elongation factor Spt5 [Rickenella mellea]